MRSVHPEPPRSHLLTTTPWHSLEAVDQSPIRPELQVLHDLLQADQVADVDRGRVFELLGRGVEVEEVDRAPERLGMGDEGCTEGGLASACWARD